jgi:lipopolysaccharide export system permease protein
MLFAVSSVYGRMSGAGEVTTIKSAGINPTSILWPTFAFAVFLSFVTVWLNDVAMSWGYLGVQRVVVNAVEDIAYGMLRSQRSYSTKAFSVSVKRVEGRKLIQPLFTFQPTGDAPAVTISAREAELRSSPGSGVLVVSCRDASVDVGGATADFPNDVIEREISLDEATRKGGLSQTPSHMPMRIIPEQISAQRLAISRTEQQMAVQAAGQMLTGDLAQLNSGAWASSSAKLRDQRVQLCKLQTESPRRWANGFSCLCFVLIGAVLLNYREG